MVCALRTRAHSGSEQLFTYLTGGYKFEFGFKPIYFGQRPLDFCFSERTVTSYPRASVQPVPLWRSCKGVISCVLEYCDQ